ncbi:hypothetical protein K437DRAFT_265170 [Tilletiaria anomala UBC 951]|uniref:Uncharacterized protein n=1 Tax=Tilletiaria anomala (strain ATCC 24038 / CBS 436.72 / UBC 951) TaxID=1037660 RepID=A0A066VEJ9_TILAU|nr:uncharacterized protein K437DRAFT_265170 [Tilletiaria anomala UBC 951]KDN37015.1 hypothetical protein K437DRAFT_265170 [Tilletiaria anomala UBC 951]
MVFGIGEHRGHNGKQHEEEARGRERAPAMPTGRGGVGNLRSPSRGRSSEPAADAARTAVVKTVAVLHAGRGGVGNVRSPSRDPLDRAKTRDEEKKEHSLQEDALKNVSVLHSGRGGVGNVRSPSRDPLDRARARDAEQKEHQAQESFMKAELAGPHTAGRGGAGNFAVGSNGDSASRNDSRERGRGSRAASGEHEGSTERGRGGGGVSSILRSLSRSRSRQRDVSISNGTGHAASASGLAAAARSCEASPARKSSGAAPAATPGGHTLTQVSEYEGGDAAGTIKTNESSSDAHGTGGAS